MSDTKNSGRLHAGEKITCPEGCGWDRENVSMSEMEVSLGRHLIRNHPERISRNSDTGSDRSSNASIGDADE